MTTDQIRGLAEWQIGGFGLYIHWPFCASKCPYCDFNSHVVGSVDQARWRRAMVSEIERLGRAWPDRILGSIYFGGGTPSLMPAETVAACIEAARSAWRTVNDVEITLEANPTSADAERFAGYSAAGVNRVSLGVQALRDHDLRALGRLHNVEDAKAALQLARRHFDRLSFDLIYGRQGQSLDQWRDELHEAFAMGPDHLSLYQLTIEPGTAFAARYDAGKLAGLPDSDAQADLWDATQEICATGGLPGYEVSNHATPGNESRHNHIYWRQGDWAAVGPGAHGRLTDAFGRHATAALMAPGAWLTQVEQLDHGDELNDVISLPDRAAEMLMMGLRIPEGVSLERLRGLGWNAPQSKIDGLVELGLLEQGESNLRATEKGRPLLNAILREILA